jgi:hypothetical protein
MRRHWLELALILATVAVLASVTRPENPTPPAPTPAPQQQQTTTPDRDGYHAFQGQFRDLVPLSPWGRAILAFPAVAESTNFNGPSDVLKDRLLRLPLTPLPWMAPSIRVVDRAPELWAHRTLSEWTREDRPEAVVALSPVAFNESRTQALLAFTMLMPAESQNAGYQLHCGHALLTRVDEGWSLTKCKRTESTHAWEPSQ